jgi:hypothetical protein
MNRNILDSRDLLKRKIIRLVDAAKRFRILGQHHHRLTVVRPEIRHSQLAYGFIRGRDYQRMEVGCKRHPNWSRVHDLVMTYGIPRQDVHLRWDARGRFNDSLMDRYLAWQARARAYLGCRPYEPDIWYEFHLPGDPFEGDLLDAAVVVRDPDPTRPIVNRSPPSIID